MCQRRCVQHDFSGRSRPARNRSDIKREIDSFWKALDAYFDFVVRFIGRIEVAKYFGKSGEGCLRKGFNMNSPNVALMLSSVNGESRRRKALLPALFVFCARDASNVKRHKHASMQIFRRLSSTFR